MIVVLFTYSESSELLECTGVLVGVNIIILKLKL